MGALGTGPDFIEALARGLHVIRAFDASSGSMTLAQLSVRTGLARPTVRRILLTLEELGYVRTGDGTHVLTPRVLELGMSYVRATGLWDVARPHLERLVGLTGESSSVGQLDGSDVVYVARVAVPKIIALSVSIGTRFPAASTSLGKVLLADLPVEEVESALSEPSRSGVTVRHQPSPARLTEELSEIRERGWALTDEALAAGVRSVAAPLHGDHGRVVAAVNVTVHAAETSVEVLLDQHLPHLLATAASISEDLAHLSALPLTDVGPT